LLLQKESKTPSPPELQQQSKPPPSLAAASEAAVAQLGGSRQNNNNAGITYDGNLESRPLLSNQPGFIQNYGNTGGIGDDALSIDDDRPWAEKSWLETWLPCVASDDHHFSNYGEERPKFQITPETFFREVILNPLSYIPAVILGLLLNLLDAISYGMTDVIHVTK
jgi:hypothetical protein